MRQFIIYAFLIFGFLNTSLGQVDTYKPADLVQNANKIKSATQVSIFTKNDSRSSTLPSELTNFELIAVDKQALNEVITAKDDFYEMAVPAHGRSDIKLELVEVNILANDGYVISKPANETIKVNHGKHYRGIIKGNQKSVVAISIFQNEVMGFISEPGKSNLVIGMLEDKSSHIIYEDNDLREKFEFECAADESNVEFTSEELQGTGGDSRALSDCVKLYLEIDNDIYIDKGSNITTVTNFVTGLFNQVATMYANEQINVVLSPLVIWTQSSPYNSSSSSGMLNAFLANTGAFDGDLAQLLSYKASGGIAYVNGLCSSNPDYSKSFSSINSTYQNVPTYSWSVMVITHEFGHLFGSSHTHACAWNGNNTAIDGCYTTEGSCPQPGIPSGGGTVMSYCHLTSAGINLNLGFGPQPGNLIRSRVTNASCTDPCDGGGGPTCTDGVQNGNETGVDCGGPDCVPCQSACTDTEAILTLVLDNYPGETTWSLRNAAGATIYSGGSYSTIGATITESFCLIDGCYDFQINDAYGDGICCGYGQGSYDISIGGQSVASGGSFNSTETVNFCAGGGAGPTCNDGVQNGDETGVDCGGSDCPACPTCNDGVQNGDETGVDCGGSDCPACPTCNDGVHNGDETGVDCGGSDCPACPTCNDGVQNGDETGVDCGGSDCPACPTCNDGVQNGDETGVDCGGSDCPACPTCNDGVQNGGETGVDCGGSDCPACPTCNDGVQNGDETGVDCGGPDCAACTDCNDGVQNGNETGIDCGGSDCPACPTCNDGVQNGDETGVDCGGPDCAACTDCNDGVQNGNETGIDCGGSDCPACPTCNDGVQNGDETGVDCGGSDCDPCQTSCTATEATLTLILDNYPGETTWSLRNAAGATIYSGGSYTTIGATILETFCLVDGCYDFQINDTYGDGICCGYGQGSYDISIGGQSVVSGGSFNSTETVNFCVGNGSGPTCNDGVQNGNETGVDCGGSDCPACPTCNDGVQNGNETDIDCGGPDCAACPTCNDGIQNGNETGIDCGGSDCAPCGGENNELFAHYFETGWDGWQDGGSDCYRYSGSRSWEGDYSIRIRDNTGTNASMTSPTYNTAPYNGVEVTFYFYPNSMENGEDFWLRYFDGSTWHTVATFVSGSSFENNTFYTATVPILSSEYNMSSNASFRFTCDASANADRIYIDQVSAVGLTAANISSGEVKIQKLQSLAELSESDFIEEMQISPNPAMDKINVKVNLDYDQELSIKIIDMLGRNVLASKTKSREGLNVLPIDISTFESGTYFLKVIDSEGDEMIDRFIKL